MKTRLIVASLALLLAACESFPIPTSTSGDPPAPNAPADMSCMQDCQGAGTDAQVCHQRCAK